ncbi:MAG: histidinol-phosphate transaminase [Acidobacteria bacterium]|nr:MAG: histidinol-phosphate transaminase [Acidobacteriota bacterium]REK03003.1 MAG: histidinol-phosphate transaminase [Acidobacteriota bacterium]REK13193.1 MAG: histidinol-phosphate transaminase [Acidobacteriota bacterium]REK41187.1 MAG: histidinol-phosphate transaminase [Acidobacteriota bacterium]
MRSTPRALARPSIVALKPYTSARDEFSGTARIFLDANENSLGSPLNEAFNRYPDPYQRELKAKISEMESIAEERVFVGNGSDEVIDLLFRVFCEPGKDKCLICPPTYGMYEVSAEINGAEVLRVPLTKDFDLDPQAIRNVADESTKLLFFCSPNNPTGNLLDRDKLISIARSVNAMVVVDEAYIHFSKAGSIVGFLDANPNLVVLRTYSKAWGLAGLRVGTAFADPETVALLNKVKPPYNVSDAAQRLLLGALENEDRVLEMTGEIISLREALTEDLESIPPVQKVYRSDANFVLVRVSDPVAIYEYLVDRGIVVRDRSRVRLCEGCLRITVGTRDQNDALLRELRSYGENVG